MSNEKADRTIAVLGATGYVGRRLVARLLNANNKVRAAGRSLARLKKNSWSSHPCVQLVEFDALNRQSVERALDGCTHAFYLIHSMHKRFGDFVSIDRTAAKNVVAAAAKTSLQQLIYLGGLAELGNETSNHLRSRNEVGEILQQAIFPTTVLKAAMIIGSGNSSFEMLRYATDRCLFILAPKYINTLSQPIAMTNVLSYLEGCVGNEAALGKVLDLGGPDVLSYRQLIEIYAEEAELAERKIFCVAPDNLYFAAFVLSLITPMSEPFIRSLIPGLQTTMICSSQSIKDICSEELVSVREAVRRAVDKQQKDPADWSSDNSKRFDEWSDENDPHWSGGKMFVDTKKVVVQGKPSDVWAALKSIGSETGWFGTDWLWQLRGLVNSLLGGASLPIGRTNPKSLNVGEQIDWWRIHCVRENELLVIKAQIDLPGSASLEYRLKRLSLNRTEICQTVRFIPRGLEGELYWHAVKPLHDAVFGTMLKGLVNASKCPIAKWTPWLLVEDLLAYLNDTKSNLSLNTRTDNRYT